MGVGGCARGAHVLLQEGSWPDCLTWPRVKGTMAEGGPGCRPPSEPLPNPDENTSRQRPWRVLMALALLPASSGGPAERSRAAANWSTRLCCDGNAAIPRSRPDTYARSLILSSASCLAAPSTPSAPTASAVIVAAAGERPLAYESYATPDTITTLSLSPSSPSAEAAVSVSARRPQCLRLHRVASNAVHLRRLPASRRLADQPLAHPACGRSPQFTARSDIAATW
mmetsp:Transcript_902/g.2262  ORF Transcript_902/g.2262 Transcript_902/m.2262 type:complete len:226 (+) Transcript_902:640-1317(+)